MKIYNKAGSGGGIVSIEVPNYSKITATNTYTKFSDAKTRKYLAFQAQGDEIQIAFSQDDADNDRGIFIPDKVWVIFDQVIPDNDLFVKSTGGDIDFVFTEVE